MNTPYFGKSIKRNEDPRLLTGQALFVDDVDLPGTAHIAFLRSPLAHARIRSIDVSPAFTSKGVIAIFTAADMGSALQHAPLLVSPPPVEGILFNERTHLPLAKDKVRYFGEPVAMVAAETRYLAEDALDKIRVDYEELEPVLDMEKALLPGAALLHEDVGSNIAAHVVQKKGDYTSIRKEAALVFPRRFSYDRGAPAAIENRGIVASWDRLARRLTVWDTTQAPIPIRNGLARILGLAENQIHLIAPFLGGGFGAKIMMFYSEEIAVPWAAMQLNRPVKWIEDRLENFYATSHERLQIHEAEIALASDGRILGVSDVFLHDSGAYDPYGLTVPVNSQCTLLGMYDIPNYYSEFTAVFTNRTIVTPFRGAGRQYGVFVMERLLDLAAQKLGLEPVEIRRRNLIQPDQFPYHNEIIYQDFTHLTYDSGNYPAVLEKTLEMVGYKEFVEVTQPRLRKEGKHVGLGIVGYVEGTGIGPYEGARVQIMNNGKVSVATGVGTQGQSHFTVFAQLAADQLGVDVRNVEVVTGDTDQFHWGTGTFASRSAVVAGNAVYAAAGEVRRKVLALASTILEVSENDLELVDGAVRSKIDPAQRIEFKELAEEANPLRGAVKPGTEPGLEATSYFGPEMGATSNGMHAMIVEVDPATLEIKIQKYIVVHDCGKMINPMVVEGQVQGGVAQGIGNAFLEQLVYDEQGRIRNANLRDFLLPTALEVPHIEVGHVETPSPLNPLGVKGTGEAGAIPVGALFAQALENALWDKKIEIREIPLSSSKLWELLHCNELLREDIGK